MKLSVVNQSNTKKLIDDYPQRILLKNKYLLILGRITYILTVW